MKPVDSALPGEHQQELAPGFVVEIQMLENKLSTVPIEKKHINFFLKYSKYFKKNLVL